jgi:ABC-type sugar transport system substrate-binding protein
MRESRRKRVALICVLASLAIVAVSASAAVGARGKATAPAAQKTVYFVTYTLAIPYFQEMAAGLKKQAKALGFKLVVSAANFDAAQEGNLVQTAITRQADAIVLAPIDRQALVPAATQAKAAGIPVVLVGDNFSAESQNEMVTFVGLETKQYGAIKAKFIMSRLTSGQGTVIVIHGPRGLDYVEAQKVGYHPIFFDYPKVKVVEGPYGNFSSEVGLKALENVLTRVPKPSAVYFDNDDLAIGGIQALKARNISPSAVVTIGSDGGPAAIAAVRKGDITATVATRPYATGVRALQVLKKYFADGKAPPKLTKVPSVLVTQETLKHLKPADYR